MSHGPNSQPDAAFGTADYFQQELSAQTPARRLAAARLLADKAVANFERRLTEDYQRTLGVDADDTEYDEALLQEVEQQVEALYQKLLGEIQYLGTTDQANQTRDYHGQYMTAMEGLFRIATVRDTDLFIDTAVVENRFSPEDYAYAMLDGPYDRYSLNIDDPIDREYAVRAIMTEYNSAPQLYEDRITL